MAADRNVEGWLEHSMVGAMYVAALLFLALHRMGIYDLILLGPLFKPTPPTSSRSCLWPRTWSEPQRRS